jgi:dipeptidase D
MLNAALSQSKKSIEGLEPRPVWEHFCAISQIPRPSKKEHAVKEWLKKFAQKHSAIYSEDSIGNCRLFKSSPHGLTNKCIALQGHIDMVTEKNKDKVHDFERDPIVLHRTMIDDVLWIKADDTTLGADNAIGVSIALSLISDPPPADKFNLPNLEVLCTIDEEVGMTGAMHIDPDFLQSKILLNLDSEEDGTFTVGCAGGQDTTGYFAVEYVETQILKPKHVKLFLGGLSGGHSGVQIHEPRANALKLIADLLKQILEKERKSNLKLVELRSLRGGSKLNAIPREAEADLIVNTEALDILQQLIHDWRLIVDSQWKFDNVKVEITDGDSNSLKVWSSSFSYRFINALLGIPHGAITFNPDIPHLVQSSTNLALVSMKDENEIIIGTSQRSSINSAIATTGNFVEAVMELAGAQRIEVTDPYPAWTPNLDSPTLKIATAVYEKLYNKKPKVEAIHAGLETGFLGERIPGLDMISYGPTIRDAHSPQERVNVKDVEKCYQLTLHILDALGKAE